VKEIACVVKSLQSNREKEVVRLPLRKVVVVEWVVEWVVVKCLRK
jgi:hypothetical protein